MKAVLIFLSLFAVVIGIGSTTGWPAVGRWVSSDSRLTLFEGRIAGIHHEFMRRSSALEDVYIRFAVCVARKECDTKPFLAERDRILRREWPRIFDRLVVKDDWGTARESADARNDFFASLKKRGREELRNRCVPKIAFWYAVYGSTWLPSYRFEGFECTVK